MNNQLDWCARFIKFFIQCCAGKIAAVKPSPLYTVIYVGNMSLVSAICCVYQRHVAFFCNTSHGLSKDGLLHVLVTRWTFINIRSLGEIVFQQFYTLPVKNEATHESSAYIRHIIHLQYIALDLPQQWCIAAKTLHPTWSCVYVAAGVVTMLAVTTVAVRHANISSSSNTATVIPRKFVH